MIAASHSSPDRGQKRKRPRAARACQLCRTKKYRCDELSPCGQCRRQNAGCVYDVAEHIRQRVLLADHHSSTLRNHDSFEGGLSPPASESAVDPGGPRLQELVQGTTASSLLPDKRHNNNAGDAQAGATGEAGADNAVPDHQRSDDGQDPEVNDVNPHTQTREFHGKTSSIAFLAALQPRSTNLTSASQQKPSLVSTFYNEGFSPESLADGHLGISRVHNPEALLQADRYHFRQAQLFLDGYFQNIHAVHPILDRSSFMRRCEDLWFGKAAQQTRAFVALYYSVMSLGALTRTWDEDKLDGLGRFAWSRKLYNLTRAALETLNMSTSVESIQCLFLMAKISQNELNPSIAYLYLGWATRASFAAGFNRKAHNARGLQSRDDAVSRLFWSLYSLEIETSFALGRPDALGPDVYHNQVMPAMDASDTAIIPIMVHFAKLIREVAVAVHLSDASIPEKAEKAHEIELKMRSWLQNLPDAVRPHVEGERTSMIRRDSVWAKRQRLVLGLRFYNLKMVLYRPFLTVVARHGQIPSFEIHNEVQKCVSAARTTIELMHETYRDHVYFRTWWYNTTYMLYAASIVLCYTTKVAPESELQDNLALARKSVQVLETMEENVVAKNAAQMVSQIIATASPAPRAGVFRDEDDPLTVPPSGSHDSGCQETEFYLPETLMSFLDMSHDQDFLSMPFHLNGTDMPFCNDAGDHLGLG